MNTQIILKPKGKFIIKFREATVECLEDTSVIYFTQEEYFKLFMNFEKEKINESISFFQNVEFLQDFSLIELEKLHFYMQHKLYFTGQSIYKQDSLSDAIYIIKFGHFEVLIQI